MPILFDAGTIGLDALKHAIKMLSKVFSRWYICMTYCMSKDRNARIHTSICIVYIYIYIYIYRREPVIFPFHHGSPIVKNVQFACKEDG